VLEITRRLYKIPIGGHSRFLKGIILLYFRQQVSNCGPVLGQAICFQIPQSVQAEVNFSYRGIIFSEWQIILIHGF